MIFDLSKGSAIRYTGWMGYYTSLGNQPEIRSVGEDNEQYAGGMCSASSAAHLMQLVTRDRATSADVYFEF